MKALIALDGTDESVDAARIARDLLGPDVDYLAINVFERVPDGLVAMRDPLTWGLVWQYDAFAATREDADTARDLAGEEALAEAQRAGVDPTAAIGDFGDPATAIVDAAREHDVDVIVVGSHDRSWFARLFDPSVATAVVKRADIPVLVAK